jgi:hypothetical protein
MEAFIMDWPIALGFFISGLMGAATHDIYKNSPVKWRENVALSVMVTAVAWVVYFNYR